jgi:predicted TPR repeat methyltransferase
MTTSHLELPDDRHVATLIDRWRSEHSAFAALIDQQGDACSALRQFGSICRRSGRHDLAIAAFTAALAIAPTDAWLWRELASVYQVADRDALAEACAARSLAIDPGHAATWLQYASLADRLGHTDSAEEAYLRALALDPTLGDARLGLGVLYLRARKFEDASQNLRQAIALGSDHPVTYLCLGQSLYMHGRFGESVQAFERVATPLAGNVRRLYARGRLFASILTGDMAEAIAGYPAIAGADAEPLDDVLRDAFSLFSGYGMHDAAAAVGRFRLELAPDDPVQRYLLDAVTGQPHDRAPAAYVASHFDEFAEGFDGKLVDVLGYRVPQDLADLVSSCRADFSAMLDLGCGTGLAAVPLRRLGGHLTGVDLSENMLAAADRRGVYAVLVKADAVDLLADRTCGFDLVFAADLLIYFGRLDDLVSAIAQSLIPGGLFAASIERAHDRDHILLPSGRFAHGEAYFESVVSRHFEVVRKQETALRLEAGHPVAGLLYVLRRQAGAEGLNSNAPQAGR